MLNTKSKFKVHSLWKEILWSLTSSVIINMFILFISSIMCYKSVTFNFTSIYYTAIISFLAVYATVIVISTNLSQDFPFEISLKYIVYSRLSLSYISLIGINALSIYILFLKNTPRNFEQSVLLASTIILFLLTILFILLFMNKFKLGGQIKSFFQDMMARYSREFIPPNRTNINNYDFIEKEGFFLFTSKTPPQETGKVDAKNFEARNISNKQLSTEQILKQKISNRLLRVYAGKGKLQVKDWNFLNKIDFPIILRINKYELGDDALSFQIICEYNPPDGKIDVEKNLKEILQNNLSYKDFPKEEFKEVFDKLRKNGTEEKLIIIIKKYIAKEDNLLERRFLFSSFEEYFKETALNKKPIGAEELLEIEIKNLYEQKELFFNSPAIVAKLEDRLTTNLIKAFRKIDYLSPYLNTSGLYIKEFLDIRYIDTFKKSQDLNWIQEYDYLITNTIKNLFLLSKSIIELNIKSELKRKYLVEQIGNLNKVLEHYEYNNDVDSSKKELTDKKLEIIRKQKEHLKDKQSELLYLILCNIDIGNISKEFFEIALRIFNLKNFNKQYYKYERFDKLDWLNYDWFTGGVQSIEPFNFNRYRLLISFYKYLNNGEIDIKKFENENFTDISYSFEKEIGNLTKEFISKYFCYNKKKFIQFKKQILKEVKEKKESITKYKQNYIIKTPLKKEYVDRFIKDCKEAWESTQKNISQFMLVKEVKGGSKIKTYFGQYTLFDKEWFLDSFNKNVALSRGSGKDFGRPQGNSKLKQVLDLINILFDKTVDKDIIIKDIPSDLAKGIQPGREYYLFYSSDFYIYNIPHLNWKRQGIETANFTLNNSIIHLCYSYNPENLLFEKGAFILEQYTQGFEKVNEPLVIQIEPIDKVEEIKDILEKNKKFKLEDDVKQMVKIRIAEKYNVIRNNNARLIRLKIDDKNAQNNN